MPTLFKYNRGRMSTWSISSKEGVIFYAYAAVEGGQEIINSEIVATNQSGRGLEEQIQLRISSRLNRQLDRGYKRTREEALAAGNTNQLGLARPMLAVQFKDAHHIDPEEASVQLKLDGHRCLVTRSGSELIAYSRQGKVIKTINHILTSLKDVIPDGWTLDGELYAHGHSLQQLSSWIKRDQAGSGNLEFVVYDAILDIPFKQRYAELSKLFRNPCPNVPLLTTYPYDDDEAIRALFDQARGQGYEGLIIRTNDRGYEDGIRSQSLIKMKQFLDEEVTVVDVHPSKDGWAVCECQTKEGLPVRVSAPGNIPQKRYVLAHKDKYIGKRLTIAFAGYTRDRIPFQPVAIRWREDV